MKRLVGFAAGMLLCATGFAAITSSGGAENFTAVAKNDATMLTFPADLADWSEVRGSALPADRGTYIDNATGGSCNGSTFTGHTSDGADLQIRKSTGATNYNYQLSGPAIRANKATYTYYIALNEQPPEGTVAQGGRYMRTGVFFPNSGSENLAVGFAICPGPTAAGSILSGADVQVFYGDSTVLGGFTANGLGANVGTGNADATDAPWATWHKCEIAIDLDAMTAVCKFDDVTIQTVDLTVASNSFDNVTTTTKAKADLLDQNFFVGIGAFARFTSPARNLWIDDVSVSGVEAPAAVREWKEME